MIAIPKTHFFMTSAAQIDQLIQPLKDYFGLTSFEYLKNFNDGSEIRLSNKADWLKYYYDHTLYRANPFERHPSEFIKAHVAWSGLSIYEPILEKARLFNIDHGITFIEPCADGCEFFFMGADTKNSHVIPKYLANIDLLERFIFYFREKAKTLLEKAAHHKITIPEKFEAAPKLFCLKELRRAEFVNALSSIEFTERELECLQLLAKGYTQKMIAKELGISPRTVETYLNQVKNKTNTDSKSELIHYVTALSFLRTAS